MEVLKVCRQRRGKSSSTVKDGSQNAAKSSLPVKEMLRHLSSGRELHLSSISAQECELIREQQGIIVEGDEIPPPIASCFEDMRFPEPILKILKEKGLTQPAPIQAQGLPVILSGRDMIGICYSDDPGKILTYALPLVMLALQQEIEMPIAPGEGPFGLVIIPNTGPAGNTYRVVEELLKTMNTENGYPELRSLLCIDGVDMWSQLKVVEKGVHIVVATPGSLKDLLATKNMNLDRCRYLSLVDIDRLFYLSLEDDLREILNQFKARRQTICFCKTFFTEIEDLIHNSRPITVDVHKSKPELEEPLHDYFGVYESLSITPPPILILCGKETDVYYLHGFLSSYPVYGLVAIRSGKPQEEIEYAISSFIAGKYDILVSTAAALEGLDFPDIQHVINYNIPAEIENGLHGTARMGRFATTHLNEFPRPSFDLLAIKSDYQRRVRKNTESNTVIPLA